MSLQKLLMTSFGLGLIKPAPGTWGSTPPVVIALIMVWMGANEWAINGVMIGLCIVFSVVCVKFGDWAEKEFAGKDPGQVVADEVAGQSIVLMFLPWRSTEATLAANPDAFAGASDPMMYNALLALGAFIAFRFFDITKLPPINKLQSIPKGWGILVDDLVAGMYALVVVQVVVRVVFAG